MKCTVQDSKETDQRSGPQSYLGMSLPRTNKMVSCLDDPLPRKCCFLWTAQPRHWTTVLFRTSQKRSTKFPNKPLSHKIMSLRRWQLDFASHYTSSVHFKLD